MAIENGVGGPIGIEDAADEISSALERCAQIAPFTDRDPTFDVRRAYEVATLLRERRETLGQATIGRKIGFTNRAVWATLGIAEPIWGDVYAFTDAGAGAATAETVEASIELPHLPEIKLEPEIVFGLSRAPVADASDEDVLDCISWFALGFELVHSVYPGWRFRAPDAIADRGLHAALVVGPRIERSQFPETLSDDLQTFGVTLSSGEREEIVYTGTGANVLGSPLTALGHLVRLLAADASAPPLRAAELVTTGTLTAAPSVGRGETWTARVSGLPLPALRLTLR